MNSYQIKLPSLFILTSMLNKKLIVPEKMKASIKPNSEEIQNLSIIQNKIEKDTENLGCMKSHTQVIALNCSKLSTPNQLTKVETLPSCMVTPKQASNDKVIEISSSHYSDSNFDQMENDMILDKNISEVDENMDAQTIEEFVLRHPRKGDIAQRRDVVLKTIIRDMRKYYLDDFKKATGYGKHKRLKSKSFYLKCVNEYMQTDQIKPLVLRGKVNIKNFNIYLGALIYPKELETAVSKNLHKKIAQETYDALYKFTMTKMKDMLMTESMFKLFLNYQNNVNLEDEVTGLTRIESNKTMSQNIGLYQEAFRVIKKINKKYKHLL